MAVRANTGQLPNSVSMLGQRRIRLTGIEPGMGCEAGPTLNRYWVGRPTLCVPDKSYSVKRSDVTRWKQGYIRTLPIHHCISQLGENKVGQGHWVSRNRQVKTRRVHWLISVGGGRNRPTRWRYRLLVSLVLSIIISWTFRILAHEKNQYRYLKHQNRLKPRRGVRELLF